MGLTKMCAELSRLFGDDSLRAQQSLRGSALGRNVGRITAACEHFVLADLLRRGYEVTKPLSPTAKHDLHTKIGGVWRGVQVKAGRYENNKLRNHRGPVDSPILALVYLPLWKIEYRAGTEQLPAELTTDLETSIRRFEEWRHLSTNADNVEPESLSESSQAPLSETHSSVSTAGSN